MAIEQTGLARLAHTAASLMQPHPNEDLRQFIHNVAGYGPKAQFEAPIPEFFDDFYHFRQSFGTFAEVPSRIHEVKISALAASLMQFSDHCTKVEVNNNQKIDAERAVWFIKQIGKLAVESGQRVRASQQITMFNQQFEASLIDNLYDLAIISRLAARGADKRLISGDISDAELRNLVKSWHSSVRSFDHAQEGRNAAGENYYFWTMAAWEAAIKTHPTASKMARLILGELFNEGPNLMHFVRGKIVKQPTHGKVNLAGNLGKQVGCLLVT